MIIDIPENYLLWIATHGNMGTGDLPKFLQNWAVKKVNENYKPSDDESDEINISAFRKKVLIRLLIDGIRGRK